LQAQAVEWIAFRRMRTGNGYGCFHKTTLLFQKNNDLIGKHQEERLSEGFSQA
jgi:hypothetical protein